MMMTFLPYLRIVFPGYKILQKKYIYLKIFWNNKLTARLTPQSIRHLYIYSYQPRLSMKWIWSNNHVQRNTVNRILKIIRV